MLYLCDIRQYALLRVADIFQFLLIIVIIIITYFSVPGRGRAISDRALHMVYAVKRLQKYSV